MSASPATASIVMGFNPGQSIDRVVAFARSRGVQPLRRAGADRHLWRARRPGDDPRGRGRGRPPGRHAELSTHRRPTCAPRRPGSTRQGAADAVLIADGAQIALPAVPVVRAGLAAAAPARHRMLGEREPISAPMSACAAPGSRRRRDAQFRRRSAPATAPATTPTRSGSPAWAMTRCCSPCGSPPTGRSGGASRRGRCANPTASPASTAPSASAATASPSGRWRCARSARPGTTRGLARAARLQLTRQSGDLGQDRVEQQHAARRGAQALAVAARAGPERRAASTAPRSIGSWPASAAIRRKIDAFGEPQAHEQRLDAAIGGRDRRLPRRCRGRCGRARRASFPASCGAAWRGRRAGRARRGRCRHRRRSASR